MSIDEPPSGSSTRANTKSGRSMPTSASATVVAIWRGTAPVQRAGSAMMLTRSFTQRRSRAGSSATDSNGMSTSACRASGWGLPVEERTHVTSLTKGSAGEGNRCCVVGHGSLPSVPAFAYPRQRKPSVSVRGNRTDLLMGVMTDALVRTNRRAGSLTHLSCARGRRRSAFWRAVPTPEVRVEAWGSTDLERG